MKITRKVLSYLFCFFAFFLYNMSIASASSTPVHWSIAGTKIAYYGENGFLNPVTKIVFEDKTVSYHDMNNENVLHSIDVSRAGERGTVIQYLVGSTLYVQYSGTLYLSPNSKGLFQAMPELTSIEGLEHVNTSEVELMDNFFSASTSLQSVDLSHFDTSNVTSMSSMFSLMLSLQSIDLSQFDTSHVTNMSNMFSGCSSLTSLDIRNFDTTNVTNMSGMFKGLKGLTSLQINTNIFKTDNVTDMSHMFEGVKNLTSISVAHFNTSNVTNMAGMFSGMEKVSSIATSNFVTTNVTDMSEMFKNLPLVTSLNLSNFNTYNVTDMHSMFEGDSSLTTLNVTSFDTGIVEDFNAMFKGLSSLTTLDIHNFSTSSGKDFSNMFYNMSSLTSLDVTNFRTSSAINMSGMFYNVSSISSLPLGNTFFTSNVTDMSYMFAKLNVTSLDLSKFNTAKVTDMSYMFNSMPHIQTLELVNFKTSNVENMTSMFANDSSLRRIYVSSLWSTNKVVDNQGFNMFYGDTNLGVDYGTTYDPNFVNYEMARIDTDTVSNQGYLSVHWDITSSIYQITKEKTLIPENEIGISNLTARKIDALQNIFDSNNVTVTGTDISLTYSYEPNSKILTVKYIDVLNNNREVSFRKFYVIKPILDISVADPVITPGTDFVMIRGRTYQPSIDASPADTTYAKTYTWTSGDDSILTIDGSTGLMSAVGAGTTTVTATSITSSNPINVSHSTTFSVEVIVPIDTFEFTEESPITIIPGETHQMDPVIGPEDHTERTEPIVTWSTGDNSKATINNSGLLTGITPGHTTVTGALNNGRFLTINDGVDVLTIGHSITTDVWVQIPIAVFNVAETEHTLYIGDEDYESITLTPQYEPPIGYDHYEEDDTTTWTSSDENVATVDQNGKVTAVAPETTTITAKIKKGFTDPTFSDTTVINVKVLALDFQMTNVPEDGPVTMEIGDSFTFETSILPLNSSYTHIDWYTDDENDEVITIDQTGTITAIGPGTKTVTAILRNGLDRDIVIQKQVKVLIPITDLELNDSDYKVYMYTDKIDDTYNQATIIPTFSPANYEVSDDLEWSVSPPARAIVTRGEINGEEVGFLKGLAKGPVTLTAKVKHYIDPTTGEIDSRLVASVPAQVFVLTSNFNITNVAPGSTHKMQIGETYTLETTLSPNDSDFKTITWSSSNSAVAEVDQNGLVTAIAPGETTITAFLENGPDDITVQRTIKVLKPITKMELPDQSYDIYWYSDKDNQNNPYNQLTITPIFYPDDYEVDDEIVWSVNNFNVSASRANQDEDEEEVGIITGLRKGTGTSIVTAKVKNYINQQTGTINSNFMDTITVNIHTLTSSFDITDVAADEALEMEVGKTHTFQTVLTPNDSDYKTVVWSCSDDDEEVEVVTVNPDTGLITANAPGRATITATLQNGPDVIVVQRQVKVLVPITDFDIDESNIDLYVGDSEHDNVTLTKIFSPSGYEVDDTIDWTITGDDVATIDSSGKVTVKGTEGTATITGKVAHYMDQNGNVDSRLMDSVTVHVYVLATAINISDPPQGEKYEMEIGQTKAFESSVEPNNATYQTITWSSEDDSVAEVDQNGVVTAKAPGEITITAKIEENGIGPVITETRRIKVLQPITEFTIDESEINLYVGNSSFDNKQLTIAIGPNGYEVDDTINWTITGDDVVTIDSSGKVTAKEISGTSGTATITGKVAHYMDQNGNVDSSLMDSVTVHVYVLATAINISDPPQGEKYVMEKGQTKAFESSVEPRNATYQTITWSSNNSAVAKVDQNGVVTALSAGDAIITATIENPVGEPITEQRTIHVKRAIDSFDIEESEIDLYVGNSQYDHATLTKIFNPVSGYEIRDAIDWTITGDDVVTIDSSGTVTAKGTEGTATITGKVAHYMDQNGNVDPSLMDTVTVRVHILATAINITDPAVGTVVNLEEGQTKNFVSSVSPNNASYQNIIWSSSNDAAVTVVNGVVTAIAPGTAIITAKIENPVGEPIIEERTVHVIQQINSFDIEESEINLYIGDSQYDHATLTKIFNPENGYDVSDAIEWTMSRDDIVDINSEGTITTKDEDGTVIITGKVAYYMDEDGNVAPELMDSVTVHVYILANSFNILNQTANETLEMMKGDEFSYTTSISPPNSSYNNIAWSTSNPGCVTVDENGLISAIAPGTATITATLQNGIREPITLTREVKVLIPIESISFSPTEYTLYRNVESSKSVTLEPILNPSNAEEHPTITWTSSNENVATVSQSGVVTAHGRGDAIITAKIDETRFATVTIHGKAKMEDFTVQNGTNITLEKGASHTIQTLVTPLDSYEGDISWTTDNSDVATITNGVIHAVNPGSATIHGTLGEFEVTVSVNVIISVTRFEVDTNTVELIPNQTKQLIVTLEPSNATYHDITWESSDRNIASVYEGLITAHNVGSTTITGSLQDGKKVTVTVNVVTAIDSISISPRETTLYMNDPEENQVQLNVTILPENAGEDKTITWNSSDSTVAEVDNNGLVTAKGKGLATITATLPNGMGVGADITVISPITSFTVSNGNNINMNMGQTHTIETSIEPNDPSDSKTISWTSSDDDVATVNSSGVITAEGYGTATIRGTLQNTMYVEVSVKVIKPITGATISESTMTLYNGDPERNQRTLTLTPDPYDANEEYFITWTSSDDSIATVDENGVVTAKGKGTATITGSIQNDISASCEVTVINIVTDFAVDGDREISIEKGKTYQLQTIILPDDVEPEEKVISWSTTKPQIATVDSTGKVTAISPGKAVINGSLPCGKRIAVIVNVVVSVTKFTINPSNFELKPNDTKNLTVTLKPTDTTEGSLDTITWAVEDTSIAEIDTSNGTVTVTAKQLGTTNITATLLSGRTATATITVTNTPNLYKRGDFTKNDVVDIQDVVLALRKSFHYVETTDEDLAIGDFNNNGSIDIADIVKLLRFVFHYISDLDA